MSFSKEQRLKLLSEIEPFSALDRKQLELIAERFVEKSYRKKELIFRQGEPADALFIVIEGLIKVSVVSEEGDEMLLVTLRPTEVFGELSLVDDGPRSASAECLEETKVISLGRTVFRQMMDSEPSISDWITRTLVTTLRRLTEQAGDLIFLDLHGRVAKLLLGLADKQSDTSEEPVELDLQITQGDLAKMVGGSRQSVNQILQTLERRGFLEMDGRRIAVTDRSGLRRRAGL